MLHLRYGYVQNNGQIRQVKTLSSKNKAIMAAKASLDKKAEDVVILDLRKISNIADYFVIASASSARRIETIADNIEFVLKSSGNSKCRRDGKGDSLWVVLDFGDCVAHVFHKDSRRFYNLERLWRDAKIVEIPDLEIKKLPKKRKK